MRVLLISPVRGHDKGGGDETYTDGLLARPPDGVTYTTYVEAMAEGTIVERGRRPRRGASSATDTGIFAVRSVEHALRRSGVLFREVHRYLSVQRGAFDLVHAHVFSVRLVDSDVPMVTSSGFPLPVLYEDRFGWGHVRVRAIARAERLLASAVGTQLFWGPPRRSALLLAQSEHYRQQLIASGADPDRVLVRALGTPGSAGRARTGPPKTVGFIATGFKEKGGLEVLAAFDKLRSGYPDSRLLIIGSVRPDDVAVPADGSVEWLGAVPREVLYSELFPRIDVLAQPTRCDSLPSYVVIEALQRGIPVVTTDLPWTDDAFAGDGVRRVPASGQQVGDALLELFDPEVYPTASSAAVDLWASRYTMDVQAELLGEAYRSAVRRSG